MKKIPMNILFEYGVHPFGLLYLFVSHSGRIVEERESRCTTDYLSAYTGNNA